MSIAYGICAVNANCPIREGVEQSDVSNLSEYHGSDHSMQMTTSSNVAKSHQARLLGPTGKSSCFLIDLWKLLKHGPQNLAG